MSDLIGEIERAKKRCAGANYEGTPDHFQIPIVLKEAELALGKALTRLRELEAKVSVYHRLSVDRGDEALHLQAKLNSGVTVSRECVEHYYHWVGNQAEEINIIYEGELRAAISRQEKK